jgi:predicted Ser/Thr protein kinase
MERSIMSAPEASALIDQLSREVKERFEQRKTLLSFDDYLSVVRERPEAQVRDAATYLRDLFQYFGSSPAPKPYGDWRRFHLFDDLSEPPEEGRPVNKGEDAVAGQEAVQTKIYELLNDFVREGRVNRLILLHGPNGSAKSSLIRCIAKGLERYSESEEGALYTFSWVFPSKRRDGSAGIGFGQGSSQSTQVSSYAYLSGAEIESRVSCEMRDHPLLLLPKAARVSWLKELLGEERPLPQYLLEGELSPKSAQIYEALLKSYQGDLRELFKHIQVERFSASRRYRRGVATVDPQLRTDAHARQITADRSLGALPQSLQHLNLYEGGGHLVEGNRGLIEYNDLLKRPLETFKYLLSTCESGVVRLDQLTLYLDALLIGSCNFEHLEAFKEAPDFSSFKGRLELIEVPYLRDISHEREIYSL